MKIYEVGGAVRDELLGLPVKDRDYVVVGATPDEMLRLGYRAVGKDFPVFLHPQTQEEYALARTERKTAPGYKGFQFHAAPDVTLEQDLARRDLSVNAIARDEQGKLIDPYGGAADIAGRVLRHVSPAFIEDPVRILRVARFAARFGFAVAPETMALMQRMVNEGEVDALVAERVWQEFAKGLMEAEPLRMFEILRESGALPRVLPQWGELDEARALTALQHAARADADLTVRYASMFGNAKAETVESLSAHLRAPVECRDLALLCAKHRHAIGRASALDARELLEVLQLSDVSRRPERFQSLLQVCEFDGCDPAQTRFLAGGAQALKTVDAAAIAKAQPENVIAALNEARLAALNHYIETNRK